MAHEFDVALSFAGEDRAFAEQIAADLRSAGVKVFYDDFYAADLWGEDLGVRLREIYKGGSRHCIMILTEPYVRKMWTSWERRQAIERLIEQKGEPYILPVRLDGFHGDVPGLPGTISYLAVRRDQARRVVDAYLAKVGKAAPKASAAAATSRPRIPRLKREFTDKERNTFLAEAFDEIVRALERFGHEAHREQPSVECEVERVTSRKAVLTLYRSGSELTKFKVWRGGTFGAETIGFAYGHHLDLAGDSSFNESFSVVDDGGELKLSPLGMMTLGGTKRAMSPPEAAEYLWEGATRHM
jgi:TIR domain